MESVKTLNTTAAQKYCIAFEDLRKAISRKCFIRSRFLIERNLPADYIKACENLRLIAPLGNSNFTVVYQYTCDIVIGKVISLEITKINELRKQHYNQRNN